MGFFKRLTFYLGLLMGLATAAAAGTVVLTYLFTGMLPSLEFTGEKPELALMTPDEVVTVVREQVSKARAESGITLEGGESNDETV
jgi:hypothetical protein